jgi:hypothetical protein
MTEAMREQFEATAWRVTADAAIHDCLNDDERDVIYFDKRDVPTGEEAEGFTVTPLYTYQAALRSPAVAGLVDVLHELQESAAYWSDYDVPLGIADRIDAALAPFTTGAGHE